MSCSLGGDGAALELCYGIGLFETHSADVSICGVSWLWFLADVCQKSHGVSVSGIQL